MDASIIQALTGWIGQHPLWSGVSIFLFTVAGSFAVVGMFLPTGLVLLALGTLIAAETLPLGSTLVSAVAGTVAGDGLSYWLGSWLRDRLREAWPFRKYPHWLARGEGFLQRHGAKSVFLGHFIGPIIPAAAGMVGIQPMRFLAFAVPAALLWVLAFIVPGIAVSTSLALAPEAATALALLVVLALITLSLMARLLPRLSEHPRSRVLWQRLLAWESHHRLSGRLIAAFTCRRRSELRRLLLLTLSLLAAAALFAILGGVIASDPLARLDSAAHHLIQGLRTPWADRIMVVITNLGDTIVIWTVLGAVLAWLLWSHHWATACYWLTAGVFGGILTWTLKAVLRVPRPVSGYKEGLAAYAFPSGHATMSMTVYGFLAVLIAREISGRWHWAAYVLAGLLIAGISVSRLYLGVHWLSDVLGGLIFGLMWVALAGGAYWRHVRTTPPLWGLMAAGLGTLLLAGTWQLFQEYTDDLQRYAPR